MFKQDYKALLQTYQGFAKVPEIYILTPPPSVNNADPAKNSTIINDILQKLIPEIASEVGLPAENVIDMYTLMGTGDDLEPQFNCNPQNCPYWIPNATGHNYLASKLYKAIVDPKPDNDYIN